MSIQITGLGYKLPSIVESNQELCENLDVGPDWIVEKTGIKNRYLVGEGESASTLAYEAASSAIKNAGLSAEDIGLIIVCTFSGDYIFPPLSAKLHQMLELNGAQIFDLQANCAGFVTGLTVATDRMKSDADIKASLVIGVEVNSKYIDRSDINTSVYMSDGASAAVLTRCKDSYGIIKSAFFTDSSNYEAVRMRGGGSMYQHSETSVENKSRFMEMNGIATWKQAVTHLPSLIRKLCEKSQIEISNIDIVIFHQANFNMIDYILKKLRIPENKTFINVREIGNTGSASVGIALAQALENGLIKEGDTVLLAAVGAGFNFSTSIWKWGK